MSALAAVLLLLAPGVRAADPVESLMSRVRVEVGVPSAQADAIRKGLREAASTPTGGERAARFAAGGWSVRLGTAPYGLAMVEQGGRLIPVGKAGNTDTTAPVVRVTIDPVLLSSAPALVAETLAHEVLGHALSSLEARKARVYEPWMSSVEDEMIAELVGGLVARELGHPFSPDPDDPGTRLLKSTEAYVRLQWFGSTGFATMISAEDAARPAEALRRRLAEQTAEGARLDEALDRVQEWELDIIHFRLVHDEPEARFATLWDYLEDSRLSNAAAREDLARAREAVYGKLIYLSLPDGLKLRVALGSRRYASFVRERRADVDRLRARLSTLGSGDPEPAPAGVATFQDDKWEQLRKLVARDLESHPDHWR